MSAKSQQFTALTLALLLLLGGALASCRTPGQPGGDTADSGTYAASIPDGSEPAGDDTEPAASDTENQTENQTESETESPMQPIDYNFADNILSDEPAVVQMFSESGSNHAAVAVPSRGRGIGLQVSVNAPFSGVRVGFPTWGNTGTYCTCSLYAWNTDYDTCVAGEALASVQVTDIADCAFRDIPFGKQFEPGEYLLVLHDGGGPNGATPGVWNYTSTVSCGQLYIKGRASAGELQVWMLFDKTPAIPFGPMDALYVTGATATEKTAAEAAYRSLLSNMAAFPTSFAIGDKTYHGFGSDFTELERTTEQTELSETTTVRFAWRDGLEITLVTALYPDYAAYEWTVYFTNNGTADSPVLSDINGCDYTVNAGNPHLRGIYGDGGYDGEANKPYDINISGMSLEINNETGRSTYNRFPYFQITHGDGGLFFAVGWPGQWRAGFESRNDKLTLTDGQVKLNTFLCPGQTIRTPLSCFLFYHGADNDRAANLWRKFYLDCNMRHPGGNEFEPAVAAATSWMYGEMVAANEENQINAIRTYTDNGIKLGYFWMDAGWYYKTGTQSLDVWLPTGTWYVDESRFPTKFRAISDYAHSVGTKTLLWFEPEVVRLDTALLGETSVRREWLLPNSTTKLVNYGNAEAREWLLNRVCTVLEEGDIDLYRQDYGVAYPAAEWQANDPKGQTGITENLYVQGYLWFFDELIARFPDMMIDACAAGGGRNDLETMRRAVPLHKSDSAYSEHDVKQSMNAALFSYLPYFGTVVTGPDICGTVDKYGIRSSYCSFPVFGYNLNVTSLDWATVRDCYNEWNQIKDYFDDDYYLLTAWNRSESEWNAWEFFDATEGAGFVELFRPAKAADAALTVCLRGLSNTANYRLTDTEGRFDVVMSGLDLKTKGLTVTLPEAYSSAVVLIRAEK